MGYPCLLYAPPALNLELLYFGRVLAVYTTTARASAEVTYAPQHACAGWRKPDLPSRVVMHSGWQ